VLAVAVLGATSWQLGVLNALDTAAFLVVGLPAGAWLDRLRKRRVMLVADLARGLLLVTVPVAWAAHLLTIGQLFVVGALLWRRHGLLRRRLPELRALPRAARADRGCERPARGAIR
jgi:hypothetical protein